MEIDIIILVKGYWVASPLSPSHSYELSRMRVITLIKLINVTSRVLSVIDCHRYSN